MNDDSFDIGRKILISQLHENGDSDHLTRDQRTRLGMPTI